MRRSVIIPSFASIARKLREKFANKGFELYQNIYRDVMLCHVPFEQCALYTCVTNDVSCFSKYVALWHTMESLNKGQLGTQHFAPCREVVLYTYLSPNFTSQNFELMIMKPNVSTTM